MAKQAAEKLGILGGIGAKRPSVAKAIVDSVGFMRGLKPRLPPGRVFPRPIKPRSFKISVEINTLGLFRVSLTPNPYSLFLPERSYWPASPSLYMYLIADL
jgi:hypothetical protein